MNSDPSTYIETHEDLLLKAFKHVARRMTNDPLTDDFNLTFEDLEHMAWEQWLSVPSLRSGLEGFDDDQFYALVVFRLDQRLGRSDGYGPLSKLGLRFSLIKGDKTVEVYGNGETYQTPGNYYGEMTREELGDYLWEMAIFQDIQIDTAEILWARYFCDKPFREAIKTELKVPLSRSQAAVRLKEAEAELYSALMEIIGCREVFKITQAEKNKEKQRRYREKKRREEFNN